MENFLLPSKIEFQSGTSAESGVLVVTPCCHGYGTTLGNALRRVLLSSLTGGAVEAFKIAGVQHEFGAVEGVQEDVVEIMLNLKQLAVRVFSEEPVTLRISKKGPGELKAGDIIKDANVEIANKELVIAHLTTNKLFEMELVVGRGRGFKPVEEKDKRNYSLGMIAIDSIYAPVKDVGYKVEYTRVGDITNYEKLTVNIETNGTITPQEAVRQAVQILADHLNIILEGIVVPEVARPLEEAVAPEVVKAEEPEVKSEPKAKKETKKKASKKK